MNYVLDQLEQLMVSVQQHEMTFIAFAVIILAIIIAAIYLAYLENRNKREFLNVKQQLIDSHNKLARRLLEQEQALNRVRRTGINNFRLTCKVGVEAGVLPKSAVKEALESIEE